MQKIPNKNAQVIVPFAIVAWLVGILVFGGEVPPLFEVLYIAAFTVGVPVIVFYLIGEAGWRRLAKSYRLVALIEAEWTPCPTGQMGLVSVDHPQFQRVKMRFVGGALRVAARADALHLSTIFSPLPILGRFFPPLQIPWSAVVKARVYEAPGWFRPASEPGKVLQVAYDPNYTGTFVEMEVGEPPVFIQLPVGILGEEAERLGIAPQSAQT